VIRGWGAVHLLKDVPHVIRVRVCAPLDLRIERMMERLATDNREAVENEIAMNEEAHTAITRRHFGVNWRDPEHYDLVLSTERLSVEECVDEVECVMKKKRFQETPESIRLMDNMALEWAVRSALRRDGRTAALNAAVTVSGCSVRLAGLVDTQREAQAAGEVAAMVEGVKDLENDLRPADTFASRYKRA
jgi:hypothetical protein